MTQRQASLQDLFDEHAPAVQSEWGAFAGVTAATFHAGEIDEAVTGVADVRTGAPVTPDHIFQFGSVTKVMTATLLMGLVDEGRLDLQALVKSIVPNFELPDAAAAEKVTVWNLLTHTSGIDSGIDAPQQGSWPRVDLGDGDDCIDAYLAYMADKPTVFAPGETRRYSNAGIVVAGRVAEKILGQSWDAAIRERIFEPVGMSNTVTLPADAIQQLHVVGHVQGADGDLALSGRWWLGRSSGPAGGGAAGTARDLARFSEVHLRGGVAGTGARILSPESTRAMQEVQFEASADAGGEKQGLGWILDDLDGTKVLRHSGGNFGGRASYWALPEHDFSFACLSNTISLAPAALAVKIYRQLVKERFGIDVPDPLAAYGRTEADAFAAMIREAVSS
ncbi:MAG TPA: serine hydrolase domain-containing protein [Acidimicrobiales bacterium]|nr:serine hydrolase domain-containing protein [Acidimicrobiales bacterium]